MAWERRGNKSYYYYKYTFDGKRLSMYLGRATAAELFSTMVESRREDRAALRKLKHEEQKDLEARFDALERPVVEFKDQVESNFREAMTAAGF